MILTKNGRIRFSGQTAFIVLELLKGKSISSKDCYKISGVRLSQLLSRLDDVGISISRRRKETSITNGNCYEYFLSKEN